MRTSVNLLEERTPMLGDMARYHLGWSDSGFGDSRSRGKMFRPLVAISVARALDGDRGAEKAVPLAAAIELLHNFTLVHDDIQDNSPVRRHRPTVWAEWGVAQAINAGDALFAAAHIALLGATDAAVPANTVLDMLRGFDATTIEIVSGQVADLDFENRQDVTPSEYIAMISGKTARIVEFAAGGGAWIAGANQEVSAAFADFGLALGLGFQVQDDYLGTFAPASDTGKAAADDIRRKKQSLPVLELRMRASLSDRETIAKIYASEEINPEGVAVILDLMRRYGIDRAVQDTVLSYHDQALASLAATGLGSESLQSLVALTNRLQSRTT
jgi:geranylgeranyl diphosphate synthase type I